VLTELSLKNFKAWKEIDKMRLAPITGLFGTNSSGKSSVLQFLLMLKQTAEADDRKLVLNFGDENSKANLGSFKDVIYDHDESNTLSFEFAWKLLKKLTLKDTLNIKTLSVVDKLRFNSDINWDSKNLSVKNMKYCLDDKTSFGMQSKLDKSKEYDLHSSGFNFVRKKQRAWPLPSPIKFYGFPDQLNLYYQNAGFLSDLQLELVQMLKRVHYLGPLREFPKRHYTSKGITPSDLGPKGEFVVDAILASRVKGKYISPGRKKTRKTLEERIAYWLKELGLIHSFEVVPIGIGSSLYEVKVKCGPKSPEVLITDVGFGVSQILPVLVMCYYVPEGSTILLEQPEIHLHPSVQMGLADVFIDVAKNRNVQVILESHSEHLLNRLQRRWAEKSVSKDDVALYFCDVGTTGSQLNELDIDIFGSILNWPVNFFGDQFGEVAARQKAQLERQTKEKI
jgi:predicted ATPase